MKGSLRKGEKKKNEIELKEEMDHLHNENETMREELKNLTRAVEQFEAERLHQEKNEDLLGKLYERGIIDDEGNLK